MGGMAKEIRFEVSDEVYEQLQQAAAEAHVDPAQYAERVVADDVARARFNQAFQASIADNAETFAAAFGTNAIGGRAA